MRRVLLLLVLPVAACGPDAELTQSPLDATAAEAPRDLALTPAGDAADASVRTCSNAEPAWADVPPDSPFHAAVSCLARHCVVSGYSDGTYRPGAPMTRAQLSKVLSLSAAHEDDVAGRHTFADVPPGSTFHVAVERLALRGIVSGYPCGGADGPCDAQRRPYFRPGVGVTRGQAAKMSALAAGLADDSDRVEQQLFSDVPPGSPFYGPVNLLARRGFVSGYACGGVAEPCDAQQRPYFRPGSGVTRGQAAKLAAGPFECDASGGSDLLIGHVSRTPRSQRFNVTYGPHGPQSWTGGQWPATGSNVTFTAAVRNAGPAASSAFAWRALLNGQVVASGTAPGLPSGTETAVAATLPFPASSLPLRFELLPLRALRDRFTVNDRRTVSTRALALRMHAEPVVFARFNAQKNLRGTFAMEDWLWAHLDTVNAMMASTGESVMLDELVIEDGLPSGGTHAPPNWDWDGSWGFDDAEWLPAGIDHWVTRIQYPLLHELSHQVGLIDEYNLNFDWNYRNQNLVNGQTYYLPYAGLMNVMDSGVYSRLSLHGLGSNRGQRRGFFGEYLYDLPAQNSAVLKDANGAPWANRTVRFYQSDHNWLRAPETFGGTTDVQGRIALPNRPVVSITTPTGHTLRPNPFGQVNVVGLNGLLLVEVEDGATRRYGWLSIYRFVEAYAGGARLSASYDVAVQ